MMTTPLGSAVAPEVKMISAVSSAVRLPGQVGIATFPGRCRAPNVEIQVVLQTTGDLSSRQRPDRARGIGQRCGIDDVAGEDRAGADDLGDAGQKGCRRAVVDGDENDAFEEASPERDDPLGPVLAPDRDRVSLADARVAQASGKRAGGGCRIGIGQRPRAIAIVIDEEVAVEEREIVEEVDERAPRHAR